ncbi:MAG: aldehyde dehydrogenase (NADP(+)) [Rhodobacteraceae bacterium]|nr:aldehyde dehydrogenase (NADP(+)) [Paracoccaceae bacterium]
MITGEHYIGGRWIKNNQRFVSKRVNGEEQEFCAGTPSLVADACEAAEAAFEDFAKKPREDRAVFLEKIAEEIDKCGEQITKIGIAETGLPESRLQGERARTVGQLRLFAKHIRLGEYLDRRHDEVLPDRKPLPRPELYMVQRPIGPVAVFGASNFPLAFSVAGGDTASALAAGCPVIVKGHSSHPGTSEIVARAIGKAVDLCKMPNGVFSIVQGGRRDVGEALVQNPLISAVGFTGSIGGGRSLFDLCSKRPTPIPFFGELGSINPVFVLPEAAQVRSFEIGAAWAGSLMMGVGQFCTNPGVVFIESQHADNFISAAEKVLSNEIPQLMLTDGISEAYRKGILRLTAMENLRKVLGEICNERLALPSLFETNLKIWTKEKHLSDEVFGPLGIVVRLPTSDKFLQVARDFEGQLTATLQMDEGDNELASALRPILERKAGRILANGFPTGVEVSNAMVHGGPYPASTNFGATSVGTLSIRRWLRPVCYQSLPREILPNDLFD